MHQNKKNEFLTKRRNAEYLRAIEAVNSSGLKVSQLDIKDPSEFFKVGKEVLDLENEILDWQAKQTYNEKLDEAKKRNALKFLEGQTEYHKTKRIKKFKEEFHRNEGWLDLTKLLFVIAIVVKYGLELAHVFHLDFFCPCVQPEWVLALTQASVISLPPVYAAIEGINYFSEHRRNIKLSEKMVLKLQNLKNEIDSTEFNGQEEIEYFGKKLRQTLEEENSDWAMRYNDRVIEPKI